MKYTSFYLLLISLSFSVLSKGPEKVMSKEEFEKKRWTKIHQLIEDEISTIMKVRKKSQKLQYRLFELKSEKVKLYKEKENKEFMIKKMKYGKKIKRKDIFKKTLKLYRSANAYGLNLLKKYPRTRYKAAIYYTLALNSRDFSYDSKELTYLRRAIEFSKGQRNVNYLARTSLAEYYYNKKNWKAAIYQYDIVLNNKDDEWYSKNLLNYGWCKLKSQKFEIAITSLEQSYKLSGDEFYVDVRDQAMTGLISFYVLGKQIERGIKFIDKFTIESEKNNSFLKLARKSSAKGHYKETETIVSLLEDRVSAKKETELYADLRLFQFDLYNQYHKPKKLMNIAQMFKTIKFSDYQQEDATTKIAEVVGAKQVILKKDFSKHDQSYDRGILTEIISYFDILAVVNNKEKGLYEYYKAETYYSVHRFRDALKNYKISLVDYEDKLATEDLRLKNIDAIFSCIDYIEFNKVEESKELVFAFNKYLSYWPKDKKAQTIFPRLFGIYLTRKDFSNMQSTLDRYIANFNKDLKKQRDLYRLQLDLLIKTENTTLLSGKINQMQKGYLAFDKQEVKKSETILANILFNSFKKLNTDGKPDEALAGYQKVHFTDYYPKSIKAEAAFNMGMIYTDTQDHNNAIKWYEKSFKFYSKKEINSKRVFLEKMSLRTTLLHDFLYAAKIDQFILKSYCSEKKKNLKVFTSAIRNDLANDYISKVFYTIKSYKKCIKLVPQSLKQEILYHLYENKHESDMISFIDQHKLNIVFPDLVGTYYERLFWKYYESSPSKSSKYSTRLKQIKTKNSLLLLAALKDYKKILKKVNTFSKVRISINKEKPDPNNFSASLQRRLGNLQPIISFADTILKKGHGQVSVMTYDVLTKITNDLSREVASYSIPINDKNFQKQFKGQMNMLTKNISSQSDGFKLKSQSLIEKYELLLTQRDESHLAYDILRISDIRPKASEMAITIGMSK